MASQLERFSKISPLLAAGGLALLLLLGVAAPAGAQDYPTPTTVQNFEVTNPPPSAALPRTGSDNTQTLVLIGGGVLLAGAGLVVVSKRHQAKAVVQA